MNETKTTSTGLRVTPSLKAKLKAAAGGRHGAMSKIANAALTEWFERNAGKRINVGESVIVEAPASTVAEDEQFGAVSKESKIAHVRQSRAELRKRGET